MPRLTVTQASAHIDLHRFGILSVPLKGENVERGTVHGFSRRTLQALVDAGHAEWVSPWAIVVRVDEP